MGCSNSKPDLKTNKRPPQEHIENRLSHKPVDESKLIEKRCSNDPERLPLYYGGQKSNVAEELRNAQTAKVKFDAIINISRPVTGIMPFRWISQTYLFNTIMKMERDECSLSELKSDEFVFISQQDLPMLNCQRWDKLRNDPNIKNIVKGMKVILLGEKPLKSIDSLGGVATGMDDILTAFKAKLVDPKEIYVLEGGFPAFVGNTRYSWCLIPYTINFPKLMETLCPDNLKFAESLTECDVLLPAEFFEVLAPDCPSISSTTSGPTTSAVDLTPCNHPFGKGGLSYGSWRAIDLSGLNSIVPRRRTTPLSLYLSAFGLDTVVYLCCGAPVEFRYPTVEWIGIWPPVYNQQSKCRFEDMAHNEKCSLVIRGASTINKALMQKRKVAVIAEDEKLAQLVIAWWLVQYAEVSADDIDKHCITSPLEKWQRLLLFSLKTEASTV